MATTTSLQFGITSSFDGKGVDQAQAQLQALKATLDELSSQRIALKADATEVQSEIANLKAQISQLSGDIKVGIADDDAQATLLDLKARLDEMQDKLLTIRADDADAVAKIAAVKVEMDALKDKTININANGDPAKSAVEAAAADMSNNIDKVSSHWDSATNAAKASSFSFVTALAAISIAMTPIAAGAVAMGGGIVSGFASAGSALGIYGLVLKTTIGAATTMVTNSNSLAASLKSQQAALGALTPGTAAYNSMLNNIKVTQAELTAATQAGDAEQNKLAQTLLNVEAGWKGVAQQTEAATMPGIIAGLTAITNNMSKLEPVVRTVAATLAPFIQEFVNFLNAGGDNGSSGLNAVVQWIEQTAVPVIQNMIQVFINLGHIIAEIAVSFASMATGMTGGLANVTAEIAKWGEDGGFARFEQTIQSMAPEIEQFLKSLATAFANVGKSAFAMGPSTLSVLSDITDIVAKLPVGVIQAFFVAFGAYKVIALTSTAVFATMAAVDGLKVAYGAAELAVAGFQLAQEGANVTSEDGIAAMMGSTAATIGNTIAKAANAVATGVATAATAAWDAVLAVSDALGAPIILIMGAIVLAVAAVGFGIYELVDHWSAAWNGIKAATDIVWGAIKAAFTDFVDFIKQYWDLLILALGPVGWLIDIATHWSTVWNGIKDATTAVWSAIQTAWTAVTNALESAWNAVGNALQTSWTAVWNAIKAAGQAVWDFLVTTWQNDLNAVKSAWDTMSSALSTAWTAFWNALKATASAVWDFLVTTWQNDLNAVKSAWDSVSSALQTAWTAFWNELKSIATTIWDGLQSAWTTFLDDVKSAWDSVSAAVQSAWSDFWNTLTSVATTVWTAIGSGLTSFWNGIKTGFQDVVNTVKTIWQGIEDAVATPINFVIGIWNDVAGAIGLPKITPVGSASSASTSTGNTAGNPAGTVGGGQTKGLATGGHITGPGGPRDDVIPAWLSNGEFVMNAQSVSNYGTDFMHSVNNNKFASGGAVQTKGGIPAFGLGGWISDALSIGADVISPLTSALGNIPGLSALKNVAADAVADTAKPILAAVEAAVPDPFMGVAPEPMGGLPRGITKSAGDAVLAKLQSAQTAAKAAATSVGVAGTIPTGSQKSLIDAALTADGIPQSQWASWEVGLNTLIGRESSWNASAVNNSDSNAAAGTPSEGLAQVIAPTFAAYRNPSLPNNLLDPTANIAAAVNYINAVYGGIGNVQQANSNLPPKGYDNGGPLMPGMTMALNTTGSIEGVLNPTGLAAVGGIPGLMSLNRGASGYSGSAYSPSVSSGGTSGYGSTVNMPITIEANGADADEVAQKFEDEVFPKLTRLLNQRGGN